jgi:ABC-2 type transport system permease protein
MEIETVYILWLRQVKRYVRSRSRIIGSIGQPLLYLFALGYGLSGVFARAGSGNYIDFLVPGVISQTILFTSIFFGVEIIWDKQFGFLKETLVAPVSRFNIILGRTLGGATIAVFQGLIVLILSLLFGFRPVSLIHLPLAVIFMFLTGVLFTSIGSAIAALVDDMQGFQLIMNFLILPLYFLSGALYPLNLAPDFLRSIAAFNPLSYGVDGIRSILTGTSYYSLSADLSLLFLLTIIGLTVASFLFSRIQA